MTPSALRSRAAAAALALLLAGCPAEPGQAPAPGGAASSPAPAAPAPAAGSAAPPRVPPLTRPTVAVPSGPFVMGSEGADRGGQDDERPRAERVSHAFEVDLHEVTNEEYARFLAAAAAREHTYCHPDEAPGKDHTPAPATPEERTFGAVADPFRGEGRARHPVVGVDWFDAYAFAAWACRRLPSEDEWERAARGTDGRTYPWGEAPPTPDAPRANAYFLEDGFPMTSPVGSFPAGAAPSGALDMAGNAWEWTASPHLAYEGAPEGTPEDPEAYVLRGGAWSAASAFLLRPAARFPRPRTYRSASVGFRTVVDPPQEAGR